MLDLAGIDRKLDGTPFHGKLRHFAQIDSTNTLAVAEAQAGMAAGQVYIADSQTAGRGRGGHSWDSAAGEGLYMSVLLRPALRADDALKLSLAIGLAAQAAIRTTLAFEADLRWPNDIVSGRDGRKLGGILTESASDPAGRLRFAVVGLGINLNQTGFGGELADTATSLRMETGKGVERVTLVPALLRSIASEVRQLETRPGEVLSRFEAASSWVRGKHVQVAEDGGYTGVTDGLNGAGLLQVRCPDGRHRIVRHGGVRELIP